MKNHNQSLSFKMLGWFILLSCLFFTYCPSAMAITPMNKHPQKLTTSKKIQQKSQPIYLLDWQENRISTTAGVFMVDDEITIIDEHNVKDSFSSPPQPKSKSQKLHRVILKQEGRKLIQITIK